MSIIRPAGLHDLPGAYRVCLQTGDSGQDATHLYRNPDLLGHVFVGPYIVGQPELALVVADDQGVAGYLLAAADTRAFERWAEVEWWPALREQYPRGNATGRDEEIIGLLHEPPRASDAIVDAYPAHLHIDLLERARGRGLGRVLIERLLVALRERGARGVHLEVGVRNTNAQQFYRHLGFTELASSDDSLTMGVLIPRDRATCA